MTNTRDCNGFLITPKTFTHCGYKVQAIEWDGRTVFDVYLGHIYRETFNSIDDAKRYIEQPKF